MNPTNIHYRWCRKDELPWVNEQYSLVGFMPSHSNESIAIAEVNGQKAGVARNVPIDDTSIEMGGLYVLTEFRKHGVARGLVEFLIRERPKNKTMFCIPFAHLAGFYQGLGFVPAPKEMLVPESILNKQRWCDNTYPHQTYIYVLRE
jgi:GNAT superfamily N-acetyltransferase